MQVLRWNKEHPDRKLDLNKDIQFITIPFGSMPVALEQDHVDAVSMIEPFMTQLSEKHKVRVIAPVNYAMPNWPVSFGIVRLDYGEKNVDVLEKYRDAWFEAVNGSKAIKPRRVRLFRNILVCRRTLQNRSFCRIGRRTSKLPSGPPKG